MKKLLTFAALFATLAIARAQVINLDVTLTGSQENPPTGSTATGGEVGTGLTYNTATGQLSFNTVTFSGLLGTYVAARVEDAARNLIVSVGDITTLSGANHAGTISGTETMHTFTASEQTALLNSLDYLNIYSSAFLNGEIRGQIISPVPEPYQYGLIMGLGLLAFTVVRRLKLQAI